MVVRDTGLGIPPAEQAIFEEFRRSEGAQHHTRSYRGLGLGLAICKRLVVLHEGSMGVFSSGEEGAGSTFYFTLPAVPAPGSCACAAQPRRRSSSRVFWC